MRRGASEKADSEPAKVRRVRNDNFGVRYLEKDGRDRYNAWDL